MKIGPHLLNQALELGASTSKCWRNGCGHLFSPKNSVAEFRRSGVFRDFSSVPQIGISFIERLGNRKGYAPTVAGCMANHFSGAGEYVREHSLQVVKHGNQPFITRVIS